MTHQQEAKTSEPNTSVQKATDMSHLTFTAPRVSTDYERRLLHSAIVSGQPEVVRKLIRSGVDVNAFEPLSDNTPLHLAAEQGDAEIIRLLVEAGADLRVTNGSGLRPLNTAILCNNVEATRMLVELGADTKAKTAYGFTALLFAQSFGHTDIVKLLLDK